MQYRADAALWRDLPGETAIEFFHLSRYAATPVKIHVVDGETARTVIYARSLFDIPASAILPPVCCRPDLASLAFRVMNKEGGGDWLAYLGAAYFRAATPFNQYGLSARGVAIDTATNKTEEFPSFTEFWLGHDPDGNLVVYALMDGPSVVGAFRFVCRKGPAGLVQDVETELTFRNPVLRLGIAPNTSMYWYGQGDRHHAIDWRPQIHDSDGLALWTGAGEAASGGRSNNPPRVVTRNAFPGTDDPHGFGLMQRDRVFADYQDDGAFYDKRPSMWVEPVGAWGTSAVQLVEIPTALETFDNIVAFWTPAKTLAAGETPPSAIACTSVR